MIKVILGSIYSGGGKTEYGDGFPELLLNYSQKTDKTDLSKDMVKFFQYYDEGKKIIEMPLQAYDFFLSQMEGEIQINPIIGQQIHLFDFIDPKCFSTKDDVQKCIINILGEEEIIFVVNGRKWKSANILEINVVLAHSDISLNIAEDNLHL